MIRKIVDAILPNITALNFSDVVSGCVTTLSKNVIGKDNKTIIKKFPIYYNEDKNACNNYSTHIDLIPNSSKKSIVYFEAQATKINDVTEHYYDLTTTVRLIFWCNLNKINKSYIDSSLLKQAIINAIPEQVANVENISFIRVNLANDVSKDVNIFGKYTYNEEEKQYLIYPFDYFALDFEVQFYYGKKCPVEIVLDPSIC